MNWPFLFIETTSLQSSHFKDGLRSIQIQSALTFCPFSGSGGHRSIHSSVRNLGSLSWSAKTQTGQWSRHCSDGFFRVTKSVETSSLVSADFSHILQHFAVLLLFYIVLYCFAPLSFFRFKTGRFDCRFLPLAEVSWEESCAEEGEKEGQAPVSVSLVVSFCDVMLGNPKSAAFVDVC